MGFDFRKRRLDLAVTELSFAEVSAASLLRVVSFKTVVIQFRVARLLDLEGAALIPQSSIVNGVIEEVEKCAHCGQTVGLTWSIAEAKAVDGTSIPLQLLLRLNGHEHSRMEEHELSAASLMFPVSSIALLLSARPRENPVIRSGQLFYARVREYIEI